MHRALKDRDAARAAYCAGQIDDDPRFAATEAAYTIAVRQYREIQREKLVAGIVSQYLAARWALPWAYQRG
ncbi:hypothetical protein WJ62_05105 [Burkholderia diffusa]|nr:hypothetical protein WJ62_05105 [Burkholderia diffusa]